MFSKEQAELLKAPLDRSNVKSRSQAGMNLSYIEGYHAINEANRIFGFGEWNHEITDLQCVGTGKTSTGKPKVSYLARVKVSVVTSNTGFNTVREDVGYGSGIDQDPASAHENAAKEAVTDAMKRALRTFGNQFGLALYDKEQRNVIDPYLAFINETHQAIEAHTNEQELRDWWKEHHKLRMKNKMQKRDVDAALEKIKIRIGQING